MLSFAMILHILAFLSTPSARRATAPPPAPPAARGDFYPRPPRGGRRAARLYATPRGLFLSTPSARRATRTPPLHPPQRGGISIHALREEGDPGRPAHPARLSISIHALREEGDTN